MKKTLLIIAIGLLSNASFAQNVKPEPRELPPEVKAAAEDCKAKSNGDRKAFGECMDSKGFKRPPHKDGEQKRERNLEGNTKQ